jgi:hypothetical protein
MLILFVIRADLVSAFAGLRIIHGRRGASPGAIIDVMVV